jgi:hypothetical protein
MTESNDQLTWAALLGHWAAFAQASKGLPRNVEGERWRAAVAPIIELQAVTFALGDIDKLKLPGERAVGVDTAQILIRKDAAALHELWRGEELPREVVILMDDARAALAAARDGGVEWRIAAERLECQHPGELVAALLGAGFAGDLYLPVPGGVLFAGSPCAFARGPAGERPDEAVCAAVTEFLFDGVRKRREGGAPSIEGPSRAAKMRQVYRQFDFGKGCVVRDLVLAMDETLPPGQAQLVPAIERGREVPVPLPIPGRSDLKPVPVEFA